MLELKNEKIAVQEALKMGIPVYGLVDTNSNPSNLTNFVPINDDSSKTIKFVLDLLSEAILEGQDSARKQGLVQKLDGDKGPKVFSMNTATKVISVKAEEKSEAAIEAKAEEKIEALKEDKTTKLPVHEIKNIIDQVNPKDAKFRHIDFSLFNHYFY